MIKVISHSDIGSKAVSDVLCTELAKYDHVIYLTATAVIRDIRSSSDELASLEKPVSFLSILDFENKVKKQVYSHKNSLSNADQRYILSRVIEEYFKDDIRKFNCYNAVRYELFKFFSDLQFTDTVIPVEVIEKIGNDYSETEQTIFDIYRHFCNAVNGVIGGSKNDGLSFALVDNISSELNTFVNKQKDNIYQSIEKCEAVFLDGFLFFDELQSFIISTALELDKCVYIVSKQFLDGTGKFILEDAIKSKFGAFSDDYELIKCDEEKASQEKAIDIAKNNYPNIFISKEQRKAADLSDGSIRFIAPFVNREEELRYVVCSISNKIKSRYDGTVESVYSALSDIAIVTAISKTHYEQRISDLFADEGVFVLNESYLPDFDEDSIEKVYFSRADFLSSDIRNAEGVNLSFEEKLSLFSKCYHKIEVNNHIRPINSYPIGQFVLRLYEFVNKGISVEGFKSILYSNWKYCTGETNIKWSRFISDFKFIEYWFTKSNQVEEWIGILTELLEAQEQIENNAFYKYHPLTAVSKDSLLFFLELLTELNSLLCQIVNVKGSIKQHVSVLRDVVMKADCVPDTIGDTEFEKLIIRRFVNTLSDVYNSSIIEDVSAQFFAQNIRAMLTDYETDADEVYSPLRISVVNLENMKGFGTSYFIMCEADNYPRAYNNQFPYTDEVMSVLLNYDLNASLSKKFGLEYHLKLERYLLKNVLDFTRDELVITFTEKEAGNPKGISVFAENLATMFDTDIVFEPNNVDKDTTGYSVNENTEQIFLPRKENYSVSELATFKLCPRLYYHSHIDEHSVYMTRAQLRSYLEAIMFCDLMKRFMDYNTKNKKVYELDDGSYIDILYDMSLEVAKDNGRFFSFLSRYEIDDAGKNAHRKVYSSIENSKNYIKGNTFTLINYKDSVYKGDGYTVTVEHDNRFVDYENKTWRMSQNSTYLEFLVLKTNDRKSELVHYVDMIKALDENSIEEDRINLVSRIIAKINIQFDSRRFAGDGIKRTNALVNEISHYDFASAEAKPSNYCNYCRLRMICMGK